MARTPSTMLELGTQAPSFSLQDTQGHTVELAQFKGKDGLLVAFICNHCPFVLHLCDAFAELAKTYQAKNLGVVAINANDADKYPADSLENMVKEVERVGYTFPYLYDPDQSVAKAYRAACTPDFFLFDPSFKLVYRGQFDDSRPGNDLPVTGQDMTAAVEALLSGNPISSDQKASLGCNIKWKPGNEPDYF